MNFFKKIDKFMDKKFSVLEMLPVINILLCTIILTQKSIFFVPFLRIIMAVIIVLLGLVAIHPWIKKP
jgi:membrane protein YdbS with pleckstrin-like domain